MTALSLFAASFFGMVAGWALRRYLHAARIKELEQSWHQTETLLEDRLAAAAAALRIEQGKVAQCRHLLSESHETREHEHLKLEALTTEADRLDRRVLELQTQLKLKGHQTVELESKLAEKTRRVEELELLLPKLLVAESQLAARKRGSHEIEEVPPANESVSGRDDLQQIHGIGPKLEGLLNQMGVVRFSQIASWTDADIERIRGLLPEFKDRVRWDNWVAGARQQHETKHGRAAA